MSVLPVGIGSAEAGGYQIERSLRFNSADSAYLNRTPASAGSLTTWTWSGWFKRGALGARQTFFSGGPGGSDTAFTQIVIWDDDKLRVGGWSTNWRITTQMFRDVGAWMHLVVVWDTGNATAADKVRVYVNGSRVTAFDTSNSPTNSGINQAAAHAIGRDNSDNTKYFSGYLTEINFIDGSALDPTSFGEFNTDTGVWQPKAYTGSYGTNGFYLNFSDNSGVTSTTLGADSSGNGNNWTPNNFSVTAGAGNDSLVDTPTPYGTDTGAGGEVRGNYCTGNPLIQFTSTDPAMALKNGNLDIERGGAGWGMAGSTIAVSSGKWYWEATFIQSGSGDGVLGIHKVNTSLFQIVGYSGDPNGYGYGASGSKFNNTTGTAYGATYTNGDVIGVALDMDAGTLTFYKNNSSQGTAFSSLSGEFFPAFSSVNGTGTGYFTANFGQRPFAYTAPSGFKALCTQNLPEPTIVDGGQYFNTVLYTGNGSTQSITGVGFQPDWVWAKSRSSADANFVLDAVRGATNNLYTNGTAAEFTQNTVTAFNADGFSVGSQANGVNTNGNSYVAWNWKANGSGVSNTDGTITSTVSANTDSGFSIVTYSGNSVAGATVGHGLGVTPSMIIVKNRTASAGYLNWGVYHVTLGATKVIYLNTTGAESVGIGPWNDTAPTSTVFSLGNDGGFGFGISGQNYVAYCFAPVSGYSAFSSYTGNGSADGPFVYTGFRPAMIWTKPINSVNPWNVLDNARGPYNVNQPYLQQNSSNAEATVAYVDFLSNGFKIRYGGASPNASGDTILYVAFAENPFKYSLAR